MCDSSFHVDVKNEGCDVSHATYLSVDGFHLEFVMTPHSLYTSQFSTRNAVCANRCTQFDTKKGLQLTMAGQEKVVYDLLNGAIL